MRAHQILFVEDDIVTRLCASDYLRDHGFRVIEAASACEAALVVGQRGYLSGLVCDIDLGPGENGFQVARRSRATYPGVPVVFVSATAATRHLIEGVSGSVFIPKPYHPRQIADALCALSPHQAAA